MQDLTTGSVARHLMKTTGFMLVTMVFQTLYVLVDLYWVGRLGKEAVAAVSICGNLMFIVLAATQMLGVGTTTLVSHAVGQKQPARARLVFNQSLGLAAFVGALFGIIAFALRRAYAGALSADAVTADLVVDYLLWFIPAMALQFGIVSMSAALRGTGNFKPGMVVQTASVILNIALAPVLIFGWGTGYPMGVAGAAIATFVAVVVGTVWLALYFRPAASTLRFVREDWRPQLSLWSAMLKIGLPAGAEFALMAAYLFIVYVVSRPFGAAAQAGFGIGLRMVQAAFLPVVALAFSAAPVAGQNFGAGLTSRVRATFKTAVLLAMVPMLLLWAVCQVAPAALIRGFSADPQVLAVGEEYLRIVSWTFVCSGVIFVASSMFQAMGNTMPSLVASFVRIIIVAIPALLLSRMPGFELRWIWYLSVAAIVVQTVLQLSLLQREFRARLVVRPAAA
jgi:putative MATE family efflux protein